jgi:hypothetical protein
MKISCEDLTFFSGVSWDMMGYKEIHDQQKKVCDMGVFFEWIVSFQWCQLIGEVMINQWIVALASHKFPNSNSHNWGLYPICRRIYSWTKMY